MIVSASINEQNYISMHAPTRPHGLFICLNICQILMVIINTDGIFFALSKEQANVFVFCTCKSFEFGSVRVCMCVKLGTVWGSIMT